MSPCVQSRGMLGDFCTLGTLSIIAQMLFDMEEESDGVAARVIRVIRHRLSYFPSMHVFAQKARLGC